MLVMINIFTISKINRHLRIVMFHYFRIILKTSYIVLDLCLRTLRKSTRLNAFYSMDSYTELNSRSNSNDWKLSYIIILELASRSRKKEKGNG